MVLLLLTEVGEWGGEEEAELKNLPAKLRSLTVLIAPSSLLVKQASWFA